MKEFGHIYLAWRQGIGHRRHIIGVIKSSVIKGVTFQYLSKGIERAKKEGFSPYTEFPELDRTYSENVLEVFGQRIVKPERQDISSFLDFWEIDHKFKEDKLYLLAHTMGLVPTDNFEFLADYHPIRSLRFITDLASVSYLNLPTDKIQVGDILSYRREIKNEHDKYAIKVFKSDQELGYIKKIHSKVFYSKQGERLKIKVKAIDKNGTIRKIFVGISF